MKNLSIRTGKSPQIKRTVYNDAFGFDGDRVNKLCYSPDGVLYIGGEYGLFFFDDPVFVKIVGIIHSVDALFCAEDGSVFAASENYIYTCKDNILVKQQELKEPAVDISADDSGNVWLLTRSYLYKLNEEKFDLYSKIDFQATNAFTACGSGRVFAACDRSFMILHGKRPRWGTLIPGMTGIPDSKILCLAADKLGYIWVGCEDGLHIFDGRSEWLSPEELQFYPKGPITTIRFGSDETVYLGTPIGLYIVSPAKTRFFGALRYLPDSKVNDIAVHPDHSGIWAATDKGMARIELVPMTLAEKEEHYESFIPYFTREGLVTARENVENGDFSTGNVCITDNDGLWTAVYTASQCLKYAVTGQEEAKEKARSSMQAILKLINMTGISGFPARAYRRPGEKGYGNGHPEWHSGSDEKGPLEWKGETSSDELVGHFMAASLYCRFCADENEKREIGESLKKIIEHIYSHDFTLCDVDGLPTTWSQFSPEELNTNEMWIWEKGINSLELISFLRITKRITGEKIYTERIDELLKKHHYGMNILTYKLKDNHANHVDDRLGFYTLIPMLMTEDDPVILRYIKFALRRHFDYEKTENNPLFAFINAAHTGSTAGLTEGIETLEEYPIDLREYRTVNSVRPDITIDHGPEKFGDRPQSLYAIPVSERVIDAPSQNAFQLDSRDSRSVAEPTEWLLAYWFGRYFEIIE